MCTRIQCTDMRIFDDLAECFGLGLICISYNTSIYRPCHIKFLEDTYKRLLYIYMRLLVYDTTTQNNSHDNNKQPIAHNDRNCGKCMVSHNSYHFSGLLFNCRAVCVSLFEQYTSRRSIDAVYGHRIRLVFPLRFTKTATFLNMCIVCRVHICIRL